MTNCPKCNSVNIVTYYQRLVGFKGGLDFPNIVSLINVSLLDYSDSSKNHLNATEQHHQECDSCGHIWGSNSTEIWGNELRKGKCRNNASRNRIKMTDCPRCSNSANTVDYYERLVGFNRRMDFPNNIVSLKDRWDSVKNCWKTSDSHYHECNYCAHIWGDDIWLKKIFLREKK